MSKISEKTIRAKLSEVLDPELNISIVDLGLVYKVELLKAKKVRITMTLTTIGCPLFSLIEQEIKSKLKEIGLDGDEVCSIDSDLTRDQSVITVVEEVLDILSFEAGNIYKGVYFVLHGRIDPLNHIGPEDIYIEQLLSHVGNGHARSVQKIKEIILAMNPDMEGEATAMFIRDRLNEIKKRTGAKFKITRLAYGLPIGGNLEYADYMTLKKSIEGRNEF